MKDAYLCVEQTRPTFIEYNGRCYELLFSLPGQRSGARDRFSKLKGVLETNDLKSFVGAPSLFLQPKTAGLLTRVDDLEAVCEFERGEVLKKHLADAGLTVSWGGPLTLDLGKRKFLKRTMQAVEGGIFTEQGKKHIQKLVELTGVFKAMGKPTPCPANPRKCTDETLLEGEVYARYRTAVGVLLYLGPDRPDILYAVSGVGINKKINEHQKNK